MKIVLAALNAKYIHVNSALYGLKEYALSKGAPGAEQIRICEFTINETGETIIRRLYREKPDLLAFSCYIWNIRMVLETAQALHTLRPELPIWLGGPEVSFETASFLREHDFVTGIMRGEGEEIFRRLLEAYAGECTLDEVRGISYRDSSAPGTAQQIRVNPDDLPLSMDELPFLYEEPEKFGSRILYYETSRGCPFSCSYCLSSVEKGIRLRSLELVLPEIRHFLDRKVSQVKLVDRTFNCRPQHARPIWEYIRDHDNGVTNFHFELEANLLQEEDLQILETMRPGLIQAELGVQSANPVTLAAVHRNPDLSKIKKAALRLIASGRMHIHLDLIAGLPYEDYESFRESFRTVYSWHPHELQLGFLKLLKGSPLRAKAQEYGMTSREQAPYEILSTAWMSGEELFRLKDAEEMLEVYYNSGQFTNTIRRLETLFEDPLSMYESLADYYEERGLTGQAQSRLGRFQILRDFILRLPGTGRTAEKEDPVRSWDELLLRDLYLRENARTRPSWAPVPDEEWQRKKRAFYEAEEKKRQFLPDYAQTRAAVLARMTHLERTGAEGAPETWLLFDYRNTDPVTGNVRCVEILCEHFEKFIKE